MTWADGVCQIITHLFWSILIFLIILGWLGISIKK